MKTIRIRLTRDECSLWGEDDMYLTLNAHSARCLIQNIQREVAALERAARRARAEQLMAKRTKVTGPWLVEEQAS